METQKAEVFVEKQTKRTFRNSILGVTLRIDDDLSAHFQFSTGLGNVT